jgi:murein L,D-transpeptidase YcbB/YkuD
MVRAGMIPARTFQKFGGAAAGLLLAAAPLPSLAATPAAAAGAAPVATSLASGSEIAEFYRARGGRPLWVAPQSGGAAQLLLGLLNGASTDGLDANRYQVAKVADALRAAQRGDRRSVDRAEMLLSQAFVAYARDLRRAAIAG